MADWRLVVAAGLWIYASWVVIEGLTRTTTTVVVSLSGAALLANLVSVLLLVDGHPLDRFGLSVWSMGGRRRGGAGAGQRCSRMVVLSAYGRMFAQGEPPTVSTSPPRLREVQ